MKDNGGRLPHAEHRGPSHSHDAIWAAIHRIHSMLKVAALTSIVLAIAIILIGLAQVTGS